MTRLRILRRQLHLGLAISILVLIGSVQASDLDPAACTYKLPNQINWVDSQDGGSAHANLYGDPSKPGLYIYLQKWRAHHMSRPDPHPNDRFITVISARHRIEIRSRQHGGHAGRHVRHALWQAVPL